MEYDKIFDEVDTHASLYGTCVVADVLHNVGSYDFILLQYLQDDAWLSMSTSTVLQLGGTVAITSDGPGSAAFPRGTVGARGAARGHPGLRSLTTMANPQGRANPGISQSLRLAADEISGIAEGLDEIQTSLDTKLVPANAEAEIQV